MQPSYHPYSSQGERDRSIACGAATEAVRPFLDAIRAGLGAQGFGPNKLAEEVSPGSAIDYTIHGVVVWVRYERDVAVVIEILRGWPLFESVAEIYSHSDAPSKVLARLRRAS